MSTVEKSLFENADPTSARLAVSLYTLSTLVNSYESFYIHKINKHIVEMILTSRTS